MPSRRVALLIGIALLSFSPPLYAADGAHALLERARREIDRLQFDHAMESLDAALRSGDSGPRQLAEIQRLLGNVSASLGLSAAAVEHFEQLLALEPAAALPEGVSPKIVAPFRQAQAMFKGRPPLAVHQELRPGPDAAVVLVVDSDPLAMVAAARAQLTVDSLTRRIEERGAGRIVVPLPRSLVGVELAAIDRYGNRLVDFEARRVDARPTNDPPAPAAQVAPAEPRPRRSLLSRWFIWGGATAVAGAGGATAVAAAVGAGFGVAALRAQDDWRSVIHDSAHHDYTEARSLEDSARRDALVANVSYGVAGGLAVVTAVVLVLEARARRAPGASASLPIRSAPDSAFSF